MIKNGACYSVAAFYIEFALQTRQFYALSQLVFAKARLKTFSEAQASCKSFYRRRLYEIDVFIRQ